MALCTELMRRLVVNKNVLAEAAEGGGMLATELADYLVTRGVPFREAHSITGQIVRFSLEQHRPLQQLTLKDLRGFSARFGEDVLSCLTVRGAIDRKGQIGGTARRRVEARIKELEKALKG